MMYAMNLRLAELAMRPGASFVSAYVAGDPVASFVSDVMRLTVNVKEGELLQAVTELYTKWRGSPGTDLLKRSSAW